MNGLDHRGYVAMQPRTGLEGALDRMGLCDAMATRAALDAEVQRLALGVCVGVSSRSDDQVAAIELFLAKIPYRREPADILRDPMQVARYGGDCDDLAILGLALLRALSIPCVPQLMTFRDGEAFHIRLAALLPPVNPQYAYAIDPVRFSEAEWQLLDIPPENWHLAGGKLESLAGKAFAGLFQPK